ncbi:MAG: LLM class flavin-dependent oxidoreductase [Chloroflexi bacterium]|nr:LLM class flavin-dependent oxidoreductase [Chloroflexota bacterium]
MPATPLEFGWVVQPVPMTAPYNDSAQRSIRANNKRFMDLLSPHFKSAWLEDHFQWLPKPGASNDTLEVMTHMAYLMAQYPSLKFGTLVLGQSYRNPALLAKMTGTLHYLSGGRFIIGIGAGWKEDEYRSYGYDYPAPGVRTRQLDEYTQILKLMLTQSPASFEGKYYTIKDAYNDPLPDTPVTLMIGGSGERGTLRTAAKYADWWNFPWRSVEEFKQKIDVLHAHCADVGRDPNEITLSICLMVSLSNDPEKAAKHAVGNFPVLKGNADDVTRQLEPYVAAGARQIQIRFRDYPSTEGVELFIEKVLPRFQ